MATIKDVARMAGVSQSTVSKYINGGQVRPANLEAIRNAIAALDYRVNPFARSLKTQRSHSIGILLPTLSISFYSYIFTALDKVFRENGYHTIISCYSSDHGLERDYLNFLIGTGVDGLIYLPENLTSDEFLEITANRGVPVVQVDRVIPGISADAVLTDNTESAWQAISYLIRSGHRRIAAISGPSSLQTARERIAGYLRALEEKGVHYDDSLIVRGEHTFATGYQGFVDLMALPAPPTAIFSTNSDTTIGIITAARERGVNIPDDVTVFGYDCLDICSMMTPPLPVIHQPEQEIGRTAAAWLIQRLEGDDSPPRTVRLKCTIHL
ncbi:LacI family DNA-binding transcriptional regulator [Flintibacter muris]|uniref:LacI family DNA-binding transcriptional regulator n=1 Tax=Flintibacter muris TaxID=2941327 RepID=UPI00203F4628|nr:LacI family DNA-binding transcriptional regulator [Flintibacter muris]